MHSLTLVRLRKKQKLSRRSLGKLLGVPSKQIWLWENGIGVPPCRTVYQMAEIFSVSTADVYGAILDTYPPGIIALRR